MMMTILSYIAVAGMVYFAIPGMLQMVLGGLFSLATFRSLGTHIPLLVGGYCAWLIIAALWSLVEGGQMPMAVLAAGFLWLFLHGWLERDKLTPGSTQMMAGEAWGIVLLAGTMIGYFDEIRWA